ncbi:MAG: hypothetical protein U0326_35510 [Polyangiales bacterium]
MLLDPALDPWLVPVPVEPSGYVPVDAAHGVYNVQTALGRIASFAWDLDALGASEVLHADLQLHPEENLAGRLGSGRAGRYRAMVLKGVGRTSLAANWNDAADRFHGNGWLSASAALRERLITEALRRDGAAHLIVPTEGLLLRAIPAAARASLDEAARASNWHLTPLDRAVVALALRPADHARISNVLWSAHHHETSPAFLGSLLLRLASYLRDPAARAKAEDDTFTGEPDAIAQALAAGIERSVLRGLDWVRRGVFWLSFHDNFTLDGRFLDLETPVYRGAPWVGFVRSAASGALHLVGFEAMQIAAQWRLFVRTLIARLRALADPAVVASPGARRFLRAVAAAMRAHTRELWPLDADTLARRVVRELADILGASRRERAELTTLGAAAAASAFTQASVPYADHVGAVIEGPQPAQPTVSGRAEFCMAKGLGAPKLTDSARWFHDAIRSIEALDDRDRALDAIRAALASR